MLSRVKLILGGPIDLEKIEELLISADFGFQAAEQISHQLNNRIRKLGTKSEQDIREILCELLVAKLHRANSSLNLEGNQPPKVLFVVGVNGVGKTTTIGKFAKRLQDNGNTVVLCAADTYRAAAVGQLLAWAERSNSRVIVPEHANQDPASVAYKAVEEAKVEKADFVIIDSAGRLHSNQNLMDELSKMVRVVRKLAEVSEILLVIDSTHGQNAISQTKSFASAKLATGIVLTKLDSSSKGGIAYSIQEESGVPIKLISFGEGIEDMSDFDASKFASALVGL
jgi:fused signal recognition particle receptor